MRTVLAIQNILMARYRRRIGRWRRIQSRFAAEGGDRPAYLEPSVPVEARVGDLLPRMTLEEKIDQMSMPWVPSGPLEGLAALAVPIVGNWNERLGIPPFLATGSSHGATFFGTAFPVAMARGASWDVDLERRVHEAIGVEAKAVGANLLLAPCINLLRHPGWGRAQETYGEDAFHLKRMAVAAVQGVQKHVMAQPKHFALNSVERDRFTIDARVDERTLREIYLPHFEAAVKEAHAASIMSAYNRVNGQYCGEHAHLLREILKTEWGFDGFVMSDWIFGTRSTADAARNGLDVEMPAPVFYGKKLLRAVRRGEVPETAIDDSVRRILRKKLEFGLFEAPPRIDLSVLANPRHRALAREAARKGMVLLKNERGALPIDEAAVRSIAVIGKTAAEARLGDMGSSWMASACAVSPLAGIRARARGIRVEASSGRSLRRAVNLAQASDVAVVVVSLSPKDEGEWLSPVLPVGGDREDLGLSAEDVALIRAVASANARTVVVVQAGGAVTMSEWIGEVAAVLFAWYPGREGGPALADILFGDACPSGKLPFTIARTRAHPYPSGTRRRSIQHDYWHGYRYFDRKGLEPLFPFGFGLSYTSYSYSNLRLSRTQVKGAGALDVSFDVKNEGGRSGEEVAQLYVSCEGSEVERAVRELKGFAKVEIAPGETRKVTLNLAAKDLACYDTASSRWQVEPALYRVFVGPSSRELPLTAELRVIS